MSTVRARTPAGAPRPWSQHLKCGLGVAALLFAAAMFGIVTRPIGSLASIRPANALLVALMVRRPNLSCVAGWAGATLGYVSADLLTGGRLDLTIWLTAANLADAAVCVWLFQRVSLEDRELRRPKAIAWLLAICICGALAASTIGGWALVSFFGADPATGFGSFFVTELGNSLMVLPMALSAPSLETLLRGYRRATDGPRTFKLRRALPALALLASLLLGEVLDGPGKLAISVPAIIWCALSYKLFATASLMFVVGMWHSILLPPSIQFGENAYYHSIISIRLTLGLLALGPMSIALTSSAYADLVTALNRLASHDSLTRALSRGAFLDQAGRLLANKPPDRLWPAGMMIDVDHFKVTNDRFGHAAGDRVLVAIGETVLQLMRQGDLFGRLGGEEFAIFLSEITPRKAMAIAERIRLACEQITVTSDDGESIGVSVSIGVACANMAEHELDALLKAADKALYASKRAGRNRVKLSAG